MNPVPHTKLLKGPLPGSTFSHELPSEESRKFRYFGTSEARFGDIVGFLHPFAVEVEEWTPPFGREALNFFF